MKRHEATFTVSGTLAGREEIRGRQYILVSVERGQNKSLFKFALDDENAQFAKGLRTGDSVLIQGALWGRKNERGYYDLSASVDGLFIRSGHSRDDAAPAAAPRGGCGVASPRPEEYTVEDNDIPF